MENNKFIIIAFISTLIFGCVKDPQDIPSGASEPVFNITGSIGTQGISIEAGKDGWTAQPLIRMSDSNLVYTSLFSQNGCVNDCNPSLEFRFYREQNITGDPLARFQHTIKPGNIDFVDADQERDSFEIILSTHPGLFMNGFSYWQDSNSVPGTTFLAEYGSVVGFDENLNVCFQSHAYTGCQYSQCISFDPKTLVPCLAHIEADLENDTLIRLVVQPEQGTPPFTYRWSNGFTTASMFLPLQNAISEVYANVTVTDALGNFTILSQTIRIQNGNVDACYFPISLKSEAIINSSLGFAAGKVEIIYRDENGIEWRSTSGQQSTGSSLIISEVEIYGLSPASQDAFKIGLSTIVELFNSAGESMTLILQDAVIPLSHS